MVIRRYIQIRSSSPSTAQYFIYRWRPDLISPGRHNFSEEYYVDVQPVVFAVVFSAGPSLLKSKIILPYPVLSYRTTTFLVPKLDCTSKEERVSRAGLATVRGPLMKPAYEDIKIAPQSEWIR